MKSYELIPKDGRKSFYGKAVVYVDGHGNKWLRSYDTIVAVQLPDGSVHRLWHGWSATTGRHLISFAGINKGTWDKMAVEHGFLIPNIYEC